MNASKVDPRAPRTPPHRFTRERILLVEDDSMISELAAQLLEDSNVQVIGPASTLAEAIELILTESVDGAILDVNLGSETSFPAAALLRKRGIPFFYTTAFVNRAHPDVADEAFLPKPYRARQLVDTLREVLDRSKPTS
ncbi:response regulator [Stenotrophomonas sp.]|uniref:response regulator n=1 Tax=Stenotrophomonas sp. TaxID=69392 RepID=UPI0028AA90EC|nr:response regulator [Stenotrophomonas sp.]